MTGPRISERTLFAGATAVAMAHAFDDALLGRQAGAGAGDHVLALAVAVLCGVAGILLFARLRPGARAGLAAGFGVVAATNGAQHAIHVAVDGPARSDLTGVLAAAAGLLLVGLGLSLPHRHRRERPAARAPRWRNRAVATVAAVAGGYLVVMPAAVAIVQTHAFREPVGEPPSGAYRAVAFRAADGLELKGWYVPSRNGAAVVLVHGGGGDRRGPLDHARMLARHGYGVLVYDARGRGESEGSPNAYGWDWPKDVRGAIAFLRSRPEVDGDRIGGLGLSTGADVLIEVAARGRDLKAIVADGATGRSEDDTLGDPLTTASFTATFAAVRVLTGSSPGPPLAELVADVAPTPLLLVSAGLFPAERDFNLRYAEAAGEGAELWDLRDVHHTSAVRERAEEYERRVVGLFDRALR
jgi:hypothetical protein